MRSYSLRSLLRQPLRTLASSVGVALAVALFASVAAFVDGSAGLMTARALAPVPIDLQVGLTAPIGTTGPSLATLRAAILGVPGVTAADPFASVDLGAGALASGGTSSTGPTALFALDPSYLRDFSLVRLVSGGFNPGGAVLSADAARALGVGPGGHVAVRIPGRTTPVDLAVSGIADLAAAGPLFASRSPDTRGEFAPVANVVIVDQATFAGVVRPALRLDAAAAAPSLRTAPVVELHVRTDRDRYTSVDPAAALTRATALRRTVERFAPGDTTVIDNVSDTLTAAGSDITLAKILFLFLGIPGVLLAAYLAHYAAGLLAEAERRELATLRARGAGPADLIRGLAVEAALVGVLGAAAGLILAAVVHRLLFGTFVPAGAGAATVAGSAALAVVVGFLTTAVALYLPRRIALLRDATAERRELAPAGAPPLWARARLDVLFLVLAAAIQLITSLAGGFKPTAAEGQSVSLSFYTLLAPLFLWAGLTLLLVRAILAVARRRPGLDRRFGPVVGGLTRRALARRARPFAAGLIALSLAVAFGVSLALFVATYEQHQRTDARYVVGGDLRVTPSLRAARAVGDTATLAVPGVTAVTGVLQLDARVGADTRSLAAIDPTAFAAIARPADSFFTPPSAGGAMNALAADPTAILISDELAKTFNILPGDRVAIRLPRADGSLVPLTFHAVGLFTNVPGFPQGVDLIAARGAVLAATGRTDASFFLLAAASADASQVGAAAARLRALPGAGALLVLTTAEAFNQDQSSLAALDLRGLGTIELTVTALMSAAAAAIFVTATVAGRRKEYVTLRAIGLSAAELRRLLASEAALVAAIGLAVGAVVGTGMATLFVQILAPLFVIPPTLPEIAGPGLLTIAALVLAGTAGAVVAGSAALGRLRPVELLREE
ncbi:MAG TPA: FtsX-like permease family protein [Candidatus Limnocylindria bacterium]|nr:FtsX-like permease family protein [Candidatus Limnocylindria bacterium]